MSIEQALLEIESRRFVGRGAQLAELLELTERTAQGAAVGYIYGPQGIGKTALLRAFTRSQARSGQRVVAYVEARKAAGVEQGVVQQVASALGLGEDGVQIEELCQAIERFAERQGLLLAIDDYDALGPEEAAVRERLLYRLPRGAAAVLTGRTGPTSLWPLERAWRRFVTHIPLAGLTQEETERLLTAQGIADGSVRQDAFRLTAGRPALLAHVADLLGAEEVAATVSEDVPTGASLAQEEVPAFLLEQILHPGSRRRTWRPHEGAHALDNVLAAASLVPAFSRDLLCAMVGPTAVADAWDAIAELPCRAEPGGWYRLEESLRAVVGEVVLREHPWLSERRLQRALRHLLGPSHLARGARRRGGPTLQLILEVLARSSGDRTAQSAGGVSVGLGAGELSRLASCGACPDALLHLVRLRPDQVRCVRDPEGNALAAAALVPAADFPSHLLPGEPGPAPGIVAALSATEATHAMCLIGSLAGSFEHSRSALWAVPPGLGGLFARLGFAPLAEGWWQIRFSQRPFAQWLSELAVPLVAAAPVERPELLAKEVLQALYAGQDPMDTQAAAVLSARRAGTTAEDLRRWVLDALSTAELGDVPCSLRSLLRMYYVDKAGPHEEIAERLDLPRATYFRAYRQALRQLGFALCGIGP